MLINGGKVKEVENLLTENLNTLAQISKAHKIGNGIIGAKILK